MFFRKKDIPDSNRLDPSCAKCNKPAATIEIVEPNAYPLDVNN